MTLIESPVPVLVSGVKRREDDPVAYAAERGSPKKLKVSLPVESDTLDGDLASGDGGASTMEDVEFDMRILLRKLVQNQSVHCNVTAGDVFVRTPSSTHFKPLVKGEE